MISTPENNFALTSVFLAGTIDMGNSPDWQSEVINAIDSKHIEICNPRRVCSLDAINDINFQIKWELYHIKKSDIVFMYFAPGSKSPITLLELGLILMMKDKKLIVVCSKDYERYQNVKLTVQEFSRPGIIFTDTLHGGIEDFRSLVR